MRGSLLAKRLCLVLIGLAAVLGMLEIAVRIAKLAPLPGQLGELVSDDAIGFRRPPNVVQRGVSDAGEFTFEHRHNSLGFRDVEHTAAKPAGTLRIVALGDSFTYGVGANFDDTYLAQLERRLNARPGAHRPVEIVKLGMPRFFPLLERRTLEEHGIGFDPDVVMVAILPNDVVDTYLGAAAVCVTGEGYLVACSGLRWGGLPAWLSVHSALGRLVLRIARARGVSLGWIPPWEQMLVDGGGFEPAWRSLETELARMQAAARAHGAAFVVVAIPQGMDGGDPPSYPEARLRRWCDAHGAVFIPTAAALVAARDPARPLYWRHDGHCTPRGYAVVAETIANALIAQGLTP